MKSAGLPCERRGERARTCRRTGRTVGQTTWCPYVITAGSGLTRGTLRLDKQCIS